MVNIEIDGKKIEAREGAMVIEAADDAGITIPRFCYHKKLSIAANCRMCLVEVEKARKPLPACATPVTEGMRVFTRSAMALEAQKGVMEFLLINHPLDCPICDQGGECDLQEMSMGYGKDVSRFTEGKRVVPDKNIGPLIATDMTRCIHCTRCVRFGQEVAGIMELGATGRGEHMEIGTYVERSVNSELSGNMIDLCPVGALTSKPYRYTARPWELQNRESVAAHDCVGSNIEVQVRRGQVMRVLPREVEIINETWLSDRDRFSYVGLNSADRLQSPLIRRDGGWHAVDWETALKFAVEGLRKTRAEHGAEALGALVSPSATLEEMYLLQKVMRGLGSGNIDHRLRRCDFRDQDGAAAFPRLGMGLAELENIDAALLIGSYTRKEQPIIAHRLRKAALRGARIAALNPAAFEFNFPLTQNLGRSPAEMVRALAGVAKALMQGAQNAAPTQLAALLDEVQPSEAEQAIAADLQRASGAVVLLGTIAEAHPHAAELAALAEAIAEASGARTGYLTPGANAAGAWLAGAVPHREAGGARAARTGLDAAAMLCEPRNAYLLLGMEPEYDCADPATALAAMEQADFVVVLNPFATEAMRAYADVLLPVGPFTETSGTFVNLEGRWQSFAGAVNPYGEARPAWKVLRVMGNLFELSGFDYHSSEEVRDEVRRLGEGANAPARARGAADLALPGADTGLTRIGVVPIYAIDAIVRRSEPLQQTADALPAAVYLNAASARAAGVEGAARVAVSQGDRGAVLPLVVDERIPEHCALIPQGLAGTSGLGVGFGPVSLTPEQ